MINEKYIQQKLEETDQIRKRILQLFEEKKKSEARDLFMKLKKMDNELKLLIFENKLWNKNG